MPHLGHELGMALIVSSAVVTIIDLTLHVAAHRESIRHNKEIKTELEVREHLIAMLKAVSPKAKKNEKRYKDGVAAFAKLKEHKVPVNLSMSEFLDEYGLFLMKQGNYAEAVKQFNEALLIDKELAVDFAENYRYRNYVAITYDHLVRAHCAQANYDGPDGACYQVDRLVKEHEEIVKAFAEAEESLRAKTALERCQIVKRIVDLARRISISLKQETVESVAIGEPKDARLEGYKKGKADSLQWKAFKVLLETGKQYRILLIAQGKASDPFLILQTERGGLIDYSPGGLDIVYDCPQSGTYHVVVTPSFPPFTNEATEGTVCWVIEENGKFTVPHLQTILAKLDPKLHKHSNGANLELDGTLAGKSKKYKVTWTFASQRPPRPRDLRSFSACRLVLGVR
jgi:tetratricopeptide (TPR) repeat protein